MSPAVDMSAYFLQCFQGCLSAGAKGSTEPSDAYSSPRQSPVVTSTDSSKCSQLRPLASDVAPSLVHPHVAASKKDSSQRYEGDLQPTLSDSITLTSSYTLRSSCGPSSTAYPNTDGRSPGSPPSQRSLLSRTASGVSDSSTTQVSLGHTSRASTDFLALLEQSRDWREPPGPHSPPHLALSSDLDPRCRQLGSVLDPLSMSCGQGPTGGGVLQSPRSTGSSSAYRELLRKHGASGALRVEDGLLANPLDITSGLSGLKFVSQGAYGVVFAGWWHGQRVAVKFTTSEQFSPGSPALREALLSREFKHLNVVQTFETRVARFDLATVNTMNKLILEATVPAFLRAESGVSTGGSGVRKSMSDAPSAGVTGAGQAQVSAKRGFFRVLSNTQELTIPERTLSETGSQSLKLHRAGQEAAVQPCTPTARQATGDADALGTSTTDSSKTPPKRRRPPVSHYSMQHLGREKPRPRALMQRPLNAAADGIALPATSCPSLLPTSREMVGSMLKELRVLNVKPNHYVSAYIMEFCSKGTLDSLSRKDPFEPARGGRNAERALVSLCKQVATGMAYLHAQGVMHGDLKPANVLLHMDNKQSNNLIAKVADFGLVKLVNNGSDGTPSPTDIGTVAYSAPENLTNQSQLASDVYSFGIVLWQMAAGKRPYEGLNIAQTMFGVVCQGMTPEWPEGRHTHLKALYMQCIAKELGDRPTFHQVVNELQAIGDSLRQATIPSAGSPASGRS